MAGRIAQDGVRSFRGVWELLYSAAGAVDDIGRVVGDQMFEFVVNLYGALEEAIYDKLRFGHDFRAAVKYLRHRLGNPGDSVRVPIFSWLMEGGLARVAENFVAAGLIDEVLEGYRRRDQPAVLATVAERRQRPAGL